MSNSHDVFRSGGKSMLPLIKGGDFLLLSKDSEIGLFDIVVVYHRKSGKMICHRVVKFEGKYAVLHGDNAVSFFRASARFEKVPRKNINNKVIGIIRGKQIIEGKRFRIMSAVALLTAGVKVLPFVVKKRIIPRGKKE